MDKKETSDDRQLHIDELNVVAGGKSCAAGRHYDEVSITNGSTGGGIIGIVKSIQTFVKTYFGR